MRPHFMKIGILIATLPLIALTACGGTKPPITTTYTIGGTLSGLGSSASVGLLDNGGDSLTVSANGAFTFKTAITSGAAYAVTVGTQPSGETCTVSSGSGTVAKADITSVVVTCAANTYTIGGTVSGLGSSASVVLLDNGGDALTITANGAFTFKTALVGGATYAVTVGTQPSGETCNVSSGSGTVATANINSVAVTCAANTYTIGGTVSGLGSSASVGLLDNGGDALKVSANGAFAFKTAIASGAAYVVTVGTQPSGETCKVSSGSGTVKTANITNVAVTCAASAAPTYDVIVHITNLIGTIGVALNGGTPSTITNPTATPAPETITFLNVSSGSKYDVTVTTQPAGYTCATSDGSGTVGSANVTVNIACTANGGGTGGFWIPYSASPTSASGKSGLFVIASDSIASSPAPTPTFVTTSVPTLLGAADQGFVDGSTPPTSVTPDLIMFAAMGTDGNTHVYGLNLTDTSTPPVPVQITNLSVPPSEHICNEGQVQSDLATPSSLAVVMYVTAGTSGSKPGTVGYCGSSPGTFELAHYSDAATVTPVTLNIPGGTSSLSALENDGSFTALYQTNGQLGGIVLWDASTGNLNFYSDATFTSSTTLLSDVSIGAPCVNVNAITNGHSNGGSRLLLNVTTTSAATAYLITASGDTPQEFFGGTASSCVTDDNNLYFIGTPSGGTSAAIYQETSAAAPPAQELVTLPAQSSTESSSLIGSNNSVLLYQNDSVSASGSTASLFSVPVGVLSTSATVVGSPYSGALETAFLASPTSSASDDFLFLTATDATSSGVSYSSQVLTTSGALAEKLSNSVLASFGPLSTELDGSILGIDGITDTDGGYGGATVNSVSVTSLEPTPLTTAGGAAYTVPAGYVVSLDGFYGTEFGAGFLFSVADPTAPYIGAAVDLSQSVILPISLANTSISALF